MTTRSIMVTCSSPTNGYFHCSTFGAPTSVPTRVMVLVLRWSCRKVAIFVESGDHTRIALSVCFQPALSVERSEEHTSELQSLMRTSYAVFCLKKKIIHTLKTLNSTIYHIPSQLSLTIILYTFHNSITI